MEISVSPDSVEPGDKILITISDLRDGKQFCLNMEGYFSAEDREWTAFSINELSLPFSLGDGTIEIRTDNTEITKLSLQRYETSISLANRSLNGHYSNIVKGNITAGTYDYISLSAKMLPDQSDLRTGITISGRKFGPENSIISFSADGAASGRIEITAYVNGAEKLRKEIWISSQNKPGPPDIAHIQESTVISDDRKIAYSADRDLKATIRPAGKLDEPADLRLIGRSYALYFDTQPRPGSGEISFLLPEEIREKPEDYSLMIAYHDGDQWIPLPSIISENNISACTEEEGVYALASYKIATTGYRAESAPTPTSAGMDTWILFSCIFMLILITSGRR